MITVTLLVNGVQTFTSENIRLNTFSLNRYSSSAVAPEFGNVSAAELLFVIDTTTTNSTLERGDVITGSWSDGTTTTSIGEFIVTNLVKGSNELSVTCLDKMILLDGEADLTGITYPITAEDFIDEIYHTGLGFTVTIDSGVYKDVSLGFPVFDGGTTYRQVLSKVCECMGANAWYKDGLNIGFYKDSRITVDDEIYTVEDTTDDSFTVEVIVSNDINVKPIDITDNEITIGVVLNPFLANYTSAEMTALANTIKTNIGNVTWYGGNVTVLPNPTLDIMDIISVETMDGITKAFPITSITYGINENTSLVAKIRSADNDYNYSLTRDIATTKERVEQIEEGVASYFWHDNEGAHVTTQPHTVGTDFNALISSSTVALRKGTTPYVQLDGTNQRVLIGSTENQRTVVTNDGIAVQGGSYTYGGTTSTFVPVKLWGTVQSSSGNEYKLLAAQRHGASLIRSTYTYNVANSQISQVNTTEEIVTYTHASKSLLINKWSGSSVTDYRASFGTTGVFLSKGLNSALSVDWDGNVTANNLPTIDTATASRAIIGTYYGGNPPQRVRIAVTHPNGDAYLAIFTDSTVGVYNHTASRSVWGLQTKPKALTITRTANTYFNAERVGFLYACEQAGHLFFLANLIPSTNIPANTALFEIGRISGWNAQATVHLTLPAQNGAGVLLCSVSSNGVIQVGNYSSQIISGGCRGTTTVPKA